jgi:hypothetical protein
VDAAQYFAVSELDAIPDLNKLSRLVITQVLEGSPKLLDLQAHPTMPTDRYVIYS